MIKVNLDIAGFYFEARDVEVEDGATVKALMDAVINSGTKFTGGPILQKIRTETLKGKDFLDSITIIHQEGSAKSRQRTRSGGTRVYPDGLYSSQDEKVLLSDEGLEGPLAAKDGADGLLVWQYYVYDKNFVDLNRRAGGGSGIRRIVPFTVPFTAKDGEDPPRGLKDGDTVVWRLIKIRTRCDIGYECP